MSRFIPCCAASDMVLVAMMSALAGDGDDRLLKAMSNAGYLALATNTSIV